MAIRRRVYEILEVARPGDRASRLIDTLILSLILFNVAALVLETVEPIYAAGKVYFDAFELVSVAIFSVEYLFRLWCCVEHPRYERTIVGRLRFARSPLALVDLLAVLPFYLPMLGLDFRFMRSLRLARIFRLAKLIRYNAAIRLFAVVLVKKRAELLVALFVVLVILVLASSLMYFVEHDANPKFSSIPAAMWWGIITLTTVGYGDVHPDTGPGKALGAVIAVLGIGMFALPTSILGAAFVEEMSQRRAASQATPAAVETSAAAPRSCPHCGKEIE
ncbi:MAG: ion transporter [Planctomycetota bacterium]|jgi:voltage-gated potassium channel